MKKFERQATIQEIVKSNNYILISEIIEKVGCSESTIRRDIDELERKGLLTRKQGSVMWNENLAQNRESFQFRQIQNVEAKKVIGQFATTLIVPNDTLFIDTGTTMLEMVKSLPNMPLTVVTNDIVIAFELENKSEISCIVLGGIVKPGTHTLMGSLPVSNLDGFYFKKAFFSPGSISKDDGFMFFNMQAMEVRNKVQKISQEKIMVADNSKFDQRGFVKGFSFDQIDVLVTNSITTEWENFLSQYLKVLKP